ncbi:hypothetical protein SLE2022_390390 [Rubroshorea leprosula]
MVIGRRAAGEIGQEKRTEAGVLVTIMLSIDFLLLRTDLKPMSLVSERNGKKVIFSGAEKYIVEPRMPREQEIGRRACPRNY